MGEKLQTRGTGRGEWTSRARRWEKACGWWEERGGPWAEPEDAQSLVSQ